MKNLDGYIDKRQTKGFYFKSDSCITKHFLIKIDVKQIEHNCLATIYELEDIPQENGNLIVLENGSEIASANIEYLCEIDLWNKYYFPKFKDGSYQWYYDFDGKGNEDEIIALSDVMKYAMKLGLDTAKITLYQFL